jgi:hypothetical protein
LKRKQKNVIPKVKYTNVIYPVVTERLQTFILVHEGLEFAWKNKPDFEHYLKLNSRDNFWKLPEDQKIDYEVAK